MENPFAALRRQSALTDSVIVSYSGGKDSAVVLDLCSRYFKVVHAFFMYTVKDLSFQEATLKWAEKKYGIEIYRIPHWEVSEFRRYGTFCKPDYSVPAIKIKDIYGHVRGVFDCHWIAAGERAADSVVRRARIIQDGSINFKRGRFFPIAYWNKTQTLNYIEKHQLKISPEHRVLGHSFRGLDAVDLMGVKTHYPQDFAKIVAAFPDVGVEIARQEMYGKNRTHQAPALHD